jgi:hypothetical protein
MKSRRIADVVVRLGLTHSRHGSRRFGPRQMISWATLRACRCLEVIEESRGGVGVELVLNEIRHLQDRGIMSLKVELQSVRSVVLRIWSKLRGYR